MRTRFRTATLIALAFASASCDESLSTLTGPTPALTSTFASIQSEIFEASDSAGRTACTTCHTSTGRLPAGGLNLNRAVAYAQLVDVAAVNAPGRRRVVPGDPDNSYLIHKLEGRPGIFGQRMPNNGPPYLTEGQIVVIKRWIEIGAPNN